MAGNGQWFMRKYVNPNNTKWTVTGRPCANPECIREIDFCNGFLKCGDVLEWERGERDPEDIRELCGYCVELFHWNSAGGLVSRR